MVILGYLVTGSLLGRGKELKKKRGERNRRREQGRGKEEDM